MNGHNLLEVTLRDILSVINPLRQDWSVRFHILNEIQAVVEPIDSLRGVRATAEKIIEDVCAVNINRLKSDKSRLINQSSLVELFISFLAKFSDICSRSSTHGVNPHSGEWEDIEGNMKWLPKTYALFVEDPFERPANTARTVSSSQLTRISEAIQATQGMLLAGDQNLARLVSVLIGPHVLQLMTRTPIPNPLFTRSLPRTPVNNHGRIDPNPPPEKMLRPSQMRKQSQNLRLDKTHNEGTANGHLHTSVTQKQQVVWKPKSNIQTDQSGPDG